MGSLLDPRSEGPRGTARRRLQSVGLALVAASGAFFVISAILGAVEWYSPVPIADMWESYVNFYVRVSAGEWTAWFENHSEHNLLLSKLFFWIDLRHLQGLSLLPLTLNVAFMAGLWAELHFAASVLLRPRKRLLFLTSALLLLPTFSWLQVENITCAFQIQFFEAFLVPLAAFQCLALSMEGTRRGSWFSLSVILGCLSAVTMGNGATLVLPLLIVMVVLSRERVKPRLLVLVPAMLAVVGSYFLLRPRLPMAPQSWSQYLEFVLLFLGSPFHAVLESRACALGAGAALLAGALFTFAVWMRSGRRDAMFLALLVFLAYIVLSSVGTAYSRLYLGTEQALVGRYHTPALLGWSTLFLLLVAQFRDRRWLERVQWSLAAVVPIALLPAQLAAFNGDGPAQARLRWFSALAINLNVRDHEYLRYVYFDDMILMVAASARKQGLTVFGLPEMIRAREYVGRSAAELGLVPCQGSIDFRKPVPEHPGVLAVNGWAFDRADDQVPWDVYFVDDSGEVIGVAFTGSLRSDLGRVIGAHAKLCGFDGYLRDRGPGRIRFYRAPRSAERREP